MSQLDLLALQAKLERDSLPYVLATVTAVHGSASAKAGSRMLVSGEGENLWGWVGGGCAESYARAQALEALAEGQPRNIQVDLDDEIFGLGMPCGGKMEIFLETHLPPETLCFPCAPSPALRQLAEHFGFRAQFAEGPSHALAPASCVQALASAVADLRGFNPLHSLCPGAPRQISEAAPSEFLVLGHSRITEELAKLGALLGWHTRVYGLSLDRSHYPSSVRAEQAQPDYAGLDIKRDSFVVVASHHKGDHHYLTSALHAGAAYIGLVASRSRCQLIFHHLQSLSMEENRLAELRAPAGLELGCRNPGEIALSIVAEILEAVLLC